MVCKVNLFDVKLINPFDNGLVVVRLIFFIQFYLFSNSNIIVNNKKMTTAKQKQSSTGSKLDTFLSQHNIDENIRKKI